MSDNDKIINELLSWLKKEIDNTPFSEIGFSLSLHDGRISKIQKNICEKVKC